MSTRRKTQLLIILIATCIFSVAYGLQSEEPKRQLSYEFASETIKISEGFKEVKYVGYFHVTIDRRPRSWLDVISRPSQWKQMSERQQQFISKLVKEYRALGSRIMHVGAPSSAKSDYVQTPNRTLTYRVFGVSKEDVQKMAEAVIEGLDNEAQRRLEQKQKELEDYKKTIAEAEKMIPKLEEEFKQLDKQADEKTKVYIKTNYKVDSTNRNEILQHTKKNMEELASYMKLANFELIGLQARINSIERFKSGGNISDPGTLIKLDQMLIADEIERAGIMARKKAYEDAFKQTKELYDIIMTCNDTAAQKLDWEMKLADARSDKNDAERVLANPPREMQPVEVHENKVVIWQVKQD
jgi:hypothetical protein